MRQHIRHIITVSVSTLGSRVLGLLRDILVYAQLGLSASNSAFILAFTIPNLFRRLLGEGALSTALIPVFSQRLRQSDTQTAFQFLNRALTRSVLLLFGLIAIATLLLWVPLQAGWLPDDRYEEVARLTLILFPYVLPICLAALVASALQVMGHFFTPAISPALLNLSMIAFLAIPGMLFAETPEGKVLWLCAGVLTGGALQLLCPMWVLARKGWKPTIDWKSEEAMTRLWTLFLPSVAGAAILQINILISRSLAFFLEAAAVSILFLAARLIELPLGMFAIAVVTVLYPKLSNYASEQNFSAFRKAFRDGSSLVAAITIPAAIGLALLADPILRAFFSWGLFDASDAAKIAPIVLIYAIGLPFYAQATLLSRAFQAQQDMKAPVRVAGQMLVLNLIASIVLMIPFGIYGLASANTLSAFAQTALLQRKLHRKTEREQTSKGHLYPTDPFKILAASMAMGIFLWLVPIPGVGATRTSLFVSLLWIIPTGALLHFSILYLLRYQPLRKSNLKKTVGKNLDPTIHNPDTRR